MLACPEFRPPFSKSSSLSIACSCRVGTRRVRSHSRNMVVPSIGIFHIPQLRRVRTVYNATENRTPEGDKLAEARQCFKLNPYSHRNLDSCLTLALISSFHPSSSGMILWLLAFPAMVLHLNVTIMMCLSSKT
jgi:hypothetical protein